MVNVGHGNYYEEEAHFPRYASRNNGFSMSNERELPPTQLHNYDNRRSHSQHDTRSGGLSPDQDSNSRPRSRIPVACGRCRKRKIRCSGNNGGPCSNCKSAGNEQCQFLRVSSKEFAMKDEGSGSTSASEFTYDAGPAASRLQCRVVPQYTPSQNPTVNYDGYQYRSNSLPSYPYPVKPYYNMPPFTEFPEENVDYGITGAPYQIIGSEFLTIPSSNSSFGTSSQGRGWTPGPQVSKTAPLYLEQDSVYNHNPVFTHGGSFPRPAISPETKTLSINGMNSLPTPTTGSDRLLPYPAANRPSLVPSFLRSHDGLASGYSASYTSYNHMMPNMVNGVKDINTNGVPESSSYLPISSTSPESLTSSQLAYSGSENSVSINHQTDMYQSNNLFHSSEASDTSYGPSSGSKRGSHSSHTTNADGSLPSLTDGNLSNGHAYIPYNSQVAYPTPQSRESNSALPIARPISAI